ncbi:hypothetical protein N7445_000591 [Penicillium cf. griseofulvum]|nr:hypothetical protein N7445_000591 [Penicillium cf. griseofulvum]
MIFLILLVDSRFYTLQHPRFKETEPPEIYIEPYVYMTSGHSYSPNESVDAGVVASKTPQYSSKPYTTSLWNPPSQRQPPHDETPY